MKKCIVISDSFKGTLSSIEICQIAEKTIKDMFPDCQVIAIPIADGGEGTVTCFEKAIGAKIIKTNVNNPYNQKIIANYAKVGHKAIIEMASAAGLPMVGQNKNPELTSTYGVGEIISHAINNGATEILLGLGGSATNDLGCGCAAALGVKFFDKNGQSFIPVGKTLKDIANIDVSKAKEYLKDIKITAMCDVKNPLYGENGAACIFAPQKGADDEMVKRLDEGLKYASKIIEKELNIKDIANIEGAGAAGGMGAGCIAFLGAKLKSGIESILDIIEFDKLLENTDFVLTGEGRIDSQSVQGKVISGIAKRTKAKNIPLIALVGSIGDGAEQAYNLGVTAMFGIDRDASAFEQFADKSALYYEKTLRDILSVIKAKI